MGWRYYGKKSKKLVISAALASALVMAGIAAALVSIAGAITAAGNGDDDHMHAAAREEKTTIHYTLIAQETTLEIAPDVRVPAWTYNGTIPGPTLRATEGDRVVLHFINETPLPHTIHLHGDHDEQDDGVFQEVQPNGTYTYDFVAGPAGALMYHCHVMPVSQHIRMGLYGAFIVDPETPLPPAREYVIVTGEYDTENQMTDQPEYILFNGYADQYWNNPLPARTNETVRIYYVNLGGSPAFGFHIHGTIFDTYPSGILENQPLKVQTWEVGAGNAAIFEARWPWEGRYLFHLHGTPEEKGTMAYFDVTDAGVDAVDGVDVARSKSIDMVPWQNKLIKDLQKADAGGKVSFSPAAGGNERVGHHGLPAAEDAGSESTETTEILISQDSGVRSSGNTFTPETVLARTGDTITWTNNDSIPHTVDSTDGTFSSGYIMKGQSFKYTFTEAGTYEYYCTLHPWMGGTVQVEEKK